MTTSEAFNVFLDNLNSAEQNLIIPPHNADYTCTNCANEKYRRNDMPNCIILMTFKFMEIAYIFLIFLTQEVGKQ